MIKIIFAGFGKISSRRARLLQRKWNWSEVFTQFSWLSLWNIQLFIWGCLWKDFRWVPLCTRVRTFFLCQNNPGLYNMIGYWTRKIILKSPPVLCLNKESQESTIGWKSTYSAITPRHHPPLGLTTPKCSHYNGALNLLCPKSALLYNWPLHDF